MFEYGNLEYYSGPGDCENRKLKRKGFWRKDFQLNNTRANYPSDKLSLNIANLTKSKNIRWFNMYFQLNGKYDVEILLEDSKRNVQPFSLDINYSNILFSYTKRSIFHNQHHQGDLIRIDKNGYSLMIDYFISMR